MVKELVRDYHEEKATVKVLVRVFPKLCIGRKVDIYTSLPMRSYLISTCFNYIYKEIKPAITINGRITASLFCRGTRLSGTLGWITKASKKIAPIIPKSTLMVFERKYTISKYKKSPQSISFKEIPPIIFSLHTIDLLYMRKSKTYQSQLG